MAAIISVPGYYYYQRGGLNNSGRLEPSQRWLDHFFRVIEMRGRHPSFSKSIFPYTSRKKLSNSSLYLFICGAKGFPFNQISLSLYNISSMLFFIRLDCFMLSSTVYRTNGEYVPWTSASLPASGVGCRLGSTLEMVMLVTSSEYQIQPRSGYYAVTETGWPVHLLFPGLSFSNQLLASVV